VVSYHRVADLESDPQLLAVGARRFAEQVDELAKRYDFSTFEQLVDDMRRGRRFVKNRIVITFDDGYADNLHVAVPVLDRFGLPATVFVTSSAIDNPRGLWWDELESLTLRAGSLPQRIDFEWSNQQRTFENVGGRSYTSADIKEAAGWDMTQPVTHPRQRLFLELAAFIKDLSPSERSQVLTTLRGLAASEGDPVQVGERMLSRSELLELDAHEAVEIGAHTVNHPRLSVLSSHEQLAEIRDGKREVESLLGHEVTSFSFPYGTERDYGPETVAAVRDCGFVGACTTRFGITVPWADRFQVPRCPAMNVSGVEFAEQVERWFAAGR